MVSLLSAAGPEMQLEMSWSSVFLEKNARHADYAFESFWWHVQVWLIDIG